MPLRLLPLTLAIAALLPACSETGDGLIDIAVVEDTDRLLVDGVRLSYGQQLVRGAISEGLVTLDSAGETVPALAERWIVTDDGRSFIFRLRETDWADGTPVDAQSVRAELLRLIGQLEGTTLGLDLGRVDEVRVMTGRVIEIRLSQPMPSFLQLLAQPELGLRRNDVGAGPMLATANDAGVLLTPMPPEERGLPQEPGFAERSRPLRIVPLSAQEAITAFNDGEVDIATGGTLASLPLAETGPLSRGNLRLDSATGLFGLQVVDPSGFLAEPGRREALAMAIDRDSLLAPFNLAGWPSTTRIVPRELLAEGDGGAVVPERWDDLEIETRRSRAARRVAQWEASSGARASVAVFLPAGPGSDRMFQRLAEDFSTIGVETTRAGERAAADLVLIDRIARYAAPRWFLNQFNCAVRRVGCSAQADRIVAGLSAQDEDGAVPRTPAQAMVEAEALLVEQNSFIPLGSPVRWSLVRGGVAGFAENRWASHPLFPLAVDPIF